MMTFADVLALPAHPYAELWPFQEDTIPSIAADIAGGHAPNPVVVYDGTLLDGRRRRAAYQMARDQLGYTGEIPWRPFDPKADGDPWDFVLRQNGHHRHNKPGDWDPVIRWHLTHGHHVKTNGTVALELGTNSHAVARVRGQLVQEGKIPDHRELLDKSGRPWEQKPPKDIDSTPPPGAGDAWEPPQTPQEKEEHRQEMKAAEAGRDFLGRELPPKIADVFKDTFYEDVVSSLRWMAKHVEANDKFYLRLRLNPDKKSFLAQLKQFTELAETVFARHRPHALCDQCGGSGCAVCFTTGWLSEGDLELRETLDRSQR